MILRDMLQLLSPESSNCANAHGFSISVSKAGVNIQKHDFPSFGAVYSRFAGSCQQTNCPPCVGAPSGCFLMRPLRFYDFFGGGGDVFFSNFQKISE